MGLIITARPNDIRDAVVIDDKCVVMVVKIGAHYKLKFTDIVTHGVTLRRYPKWREDNPQDHEELTYLEQSIRSLQDE